jgi:hypothetical protein
VATRFQTLDELVESLRARGVRDVRLTAKVATTTSPGGKQITFRGRLRVSADLGDGEQAEYEEQVLRYVTETKAPELPVSSKVAPALRTAQAALAQQLQAYRGNYRAAMQAARSNLTARLKRVGVNVVEAED